MRCFSGTEQNKQTKIKMQQQQQKRRRRTQNLRVKNLDIVKHVFVMGF